MHRKDFRCLLRLRVRWAEVDMQKIVFNGHYLTYIDTAMSEYWRAVALPYEAAMQVLGGEMVVKKATLEYHAPARVDDALQVGMRCAHLGNSSCRFIAAIFRDDKLRMAGGVVDLEIYRGVTHEFIKMGRVIPEARQAHQHAAAALRRAFTLE